MLVCSHHNQMQSPEAPSPAEPTIATKATRLLLPVPGTTGATGTGTVDPVTPLCVKKKLFAASPSSPCKDLQVWVQQVNNHLYYCATLGEGNGQLLASMQMINKHGGHDGPYQECLHQPLPDRAWLAVVAAGYCLMQFILKFALQTISEAHLKHLLHSLPCSQFLLYGIRRRHCAKEAHSHGGNTAMEATLCLASTGGITPGQGAMIKGSGDASPEEKPSEPLLETPTPDRPCQRVGVDLFELKGRNYVVIVAPVFHRAASLLFLLGACGEYNHFLVQRSPGVQHSFIPPQLLSYHNRLVTAISNQ
ncbi:hypothetical protein ISCGN_013069 [Ixodes scapularis]